MTNLDFSKLWISKLHQESGLADVPGLRAQYYHVNQQAEQTTDTCYSGGIRGIVELEVLSAIQNAMGNQIPIQACFDLIVGTGYGTRRCDILDSANKLSEQLVG